MAKIKKIELSPRWQVFTIHLDNDRDFTFPRSEYKELHEACSYEQLNNFDIKEYEICWNDLGLTLNLIELLKKHPYTGYFLDRDNDCHWFLVMNDFRKEWFDWTNLDSNNEDSWNVPPFAESINGPTSVIFFNPIKI